MIKECPVIINNDAVSVVRFDDIDIQFPPVGKNIKTLNVKFEDGKYSVVKNAEKEKEKEKPAIQKTETKDEEKIEVKAIENIKKDNMKTTKRKQYHMDIE